MFTYYFSWQFVTPIVITCEKTLEKLLDVDNAAHNQEKNLKLAAQVIKETINNKWYKLW